MMNYFFAAALAALAAARSHAADAQAAVPALVPAAAAPAVPATLWARLMSESRYAEAIPLLEREARANPGAPDILLNLGWSFWHVRRLEEARRVAATLLKLDPGNRAFLIFMANTNIELGRGPAAAELLRRVLRASPGDRDASLLLARAQFRSGRELEALSIVDELLARHPDDAGARYRRALFLSELGRKREALAALDKLLEGEPSNAAYRRSRAGVLSDLGRSAEAKDEWKSLTRNDLDAHSMMNLGWAYWRERNLDAAWEIAVTLVKLDDRNPSFLRFMANLELERQNDESALRLAEKIMRLSPEDPDAALILSKALFRLHRVKEASAILQKLIVSHPESPSVQYRWAELLVGTRQFKEALRIFDRLIKADPANDAYRTNRATVLYEMGRFDDALALWRKRALADEPDTSALRRLREDALNRRSWKEAADWQMKLIAAEPRDPTEWEALSRIYTELKNPAKALWAAERAISADPVLINAYYMKAEVLVAMGDWKAASDAYTDIIRRHPNGIRAIVGLSHALEAKGDFDGALRMLRRIETLTDSSVSPYLDLQRANIMSESGRYAQAHKLLARLESDTQTPIPVLLYHGIARHDRGDSISVDTFRAQMRALKKKGYQTITVSELARAFQGKAKLPAKPLVLTFDDGRVDSFENADPVLKETDFRATMFVHVSRMRRPYFHASVEEISRWQATGRWELQAHGFQAHDPLPLDGFGRRGHFLPNRKWLAGAGRLETLAEYRMRIEFDYQEAKRGVESIVPGQRVVAFAYPFGDYGQNDYSNTPEAAGLNQALVQKEYQLAFVQDQRGVNTLSSPQTTLKRYSVPRNMPAEALTAHLALSDLRVQAKLLHAQLWLRTDQVGRANAVFQELEAMGVDEPRVWMEKAVVLQRGGDISYARNLFSQAAEAEPDKDGPGGELAKARLAQAARAAAPVASAEVQRFTDSDRNEISKALLRGVGVVRSVRVEGWVGQGEYSELRDASTPTPLIRSREGGAQLRWFAVPTLELGGVYIRRDFSGGAGFADNYFLTAGWQAIPELRVSLRDGLGSVETAGAIRRSRKYHTNGGGIAWDPALTWRINTDYDQSRYNDSNLSQDVRLRVTKRLSERVALGAAYFHGESKQSQAEYFTPRRLNQYTGVLTLSETFGEISPLTGRVRADALLQYEAGYGLQETGSRRVHAVRAALGLRLTDRVAVRFDGQYSESPTYISRRAEGALSVSF